MQADAELPGPMGPKRGYLFAFLFFFAGLRWADLLLGISFLPGFRCTGENISRTLNDDPSRLNGVKCTSTFMATRPVLSSCPRKMNAFLFSVTARTLRSND